MVAMFRHTYIWFCECKGEWLSHSRYAVREREYRTTVEWKTQVGREWEEPWGKAVYIIIFIGKVLCHTAIHTVQPCIVCLII